MIHYIFSRDDTRYLFLKGDNEKDYEDLELLRDCTNLVNPICYLPTYKGEEKKEMFLFEYFQKGGTRLFYSAIGMWQEYYKFFKEYNIQYDGLVENMDIFKRPMKHTYEEFHDIVDSWGLKFPPRPYQYEAAYKILSWKSSLSQLATRAGKTLIAYLVFRYSMEYMDVKNILMIVPSIDLVKQGYNDFNEYAEFFKTECIWGGGKLVESSNLTIGTFQSLIKFLDRSSKKYNPAFFSKFDLVFVDEVHRATAEQIKTIISQPFMLNLKVAFGMTGTLPKEKTIERFCLASLLGAKIQTIKPKYLMDNGYISNIEIRQRILKYKDKRKVEDAYIRSAEYRLSEYEYDEFGDKIPLEEPFFLFKEKKKLPIGIKELKESITTEEERKEYIKTLQELVKESEHTNMLVVEQMMVHIMEERVDYILELLKECPRNTIILATHREYVKHIYNRVAERYPDRIVSYIQGGVSSKKRALINKQLAENDNCILVASYATCGTGLTFKGLCYGVFAESFKSEIINMQSLGRGLGLVEGKEKYILYDLVDTFPTYKFGLQGQEKRKIYEDNDYYYNCKIVNL